MVVPDCHLPQDSTGRNGPEIKPKRFRLYTRKYLSSFNICRTTLEKSLSQKSMAVLSLERNFFAMLIYNIYTYIVIIIYIIYIDNIDRYIY